MPIPTAAQIAALRVVVARYLPDTYVVQRTTGTNDGSGGQTDVVTTPSTGPCRLRQASMGTELVIASKLDTVNPASIVLPWDADVTPADRLIVNGTRTFEVAALNTDGNNTLSRIAICKEIT